MKRVKRTKEEKKRRRHAVWTLMKPLQVMV